MVLLTKIYTRGGDKGKTSLGDGTRVPKTDPRIQAIGCVDEVNACIGLVRTFVVGEGAQTLAQIQNDLFDVGADLCVPVSGQKEIVLRLAQNRIDFLESEMDRLNEELSPLTSFVLPGGSQASAHLHLARTWTRRAEREICGFLETQSSESAAAHMTVLRYINRLSDYLFVLARFANKKGEGDVLWQPGQVRSA